MTHIKSPLEFYKHLPQTNCGRCYLPSCLAFSAAVVKGDKRPSECPFLDQDILDMFSQQRETRVPYELKRLVELNLLKDKICQIDLPAQARKLGGKTVGDKMTIPCLGKDFWIDPKGNVTSECHTHTGLTIPLLTYILQQPSTLQENSEKEWIAFRKLKNGAAMAPLFEQKCEGTLKKIADSHPDLFENLVSIFSGQKSVNYFSSDISLVLYPLPKIPVLICYWEAEDDLDSMLRIFFDSTADRFLESESIYALVVGLVMMFDKIAIQHV